MASHETIAVELPVKTALAANETWAGPTNDRLGDGFMFRRTRVDVYAVQAGTLYLDTWDQPDGSDTATTTFAVGAAATKPTGWVELTKRYWRWRFTNGATAQAGVIIWEEKSGRPLADVTLTNRSVTQFEKAATAGAGVAQLTAAKYAGAVQAFITVEAANIRYRTDGTDPDATTGHLAVAGSTINLYTALDISRFRFIRTGAADATLQASYLG